MTLLNELNNNLNKSNASIKYLVLVEVVQMLLKGCIEIK